MQGPDPGVDFLFASHLFGLFGAGLRRLFAFPKPAARIAALPIEFIFLNSFFEVAVPRVLRRPRPLPLRGAAVSFGVLFGVAAALTVAASKEPSID